MTTVVFFEKPGCIGNARQKAILEEAGYEVVCRNLLREPWLAESLRPFFGERPVTEWFNPTAKRVKSGEVVPKELGEEDALALLVADPMLIRRPLIRTDKGCTSGFRPGPDLGRLGIEVAMPGDDPEACPRPDPRTP